MLAKFGLILLVLLATALAFVAGALLPADPFGDAAPAAPAAEHTADKQADEGAADPAATDPAQKADKADKALPYADLTLPNVLPDKAQLGLQIGLFIDAEQAAPVAERVARLGQKTRLLAVTDPNGADWQLLAAGPYADLEQAQTQRLALRRGLDMGHPPAILLLPPDKPPAKKD